jgi:hypothetical protein
MKPSIGFYYGANMDNAFSNSVEVKVTDNWLLPNTFPDSVRWISKMPGTAGASLDMHIKKLCG